MYRRYIKRKENIIIQAIDILDETGVRGLTTKEIAKRQGITEPAIYKQYTGKQEIILAILDRFSVFDEMIKNTILEQSMSCKEGIKFYAKSYAEYYENYPQITTVMFSYDLYKYDSRTNKKMIEIMENRYNLVHNMVKMGQETGEIYKNLDSSDMADMILGQIWSLTFKWKTKGCSFSLKDKILSAVDLLLTV